MSGGEQQMLAIGRALMADPKLLLLDEPSMGIAPVLVERIYETIAEINRQGTTILLVEQNANFALGGLEARLRARDRRDRAERRVGQAARQPRGPEGVPGRMTVFAAMGAKALYLLYVWLASAIVASYAVRPQGLRREGRASRSGCCSASIGAIIWLLVAGAGGLALEAPGAVRQRRQDRGRGARGARARAEGRAEMDLTWGLYFPLILIAIAYAVVSATAGVMGGPRQRRAAPSGCATSAFLILAAGRSLGGHPDRARAHQPAGRHRRHAHRLSS